MAGKAYRAVGWLWLWVFLVLVGCGGTLTVSPEPTPTPGARFLMPTPGASPAPTRTPTPEALIYIVEEGDTLYAIALRFHVSLEELIEANHLENPDQLHVGQELIIPAPRAPTVTPSP
ncbi:MAG: LysM peptidoglycan-binding domain-containing protein [Chloroflexia bacterium]